MTREVVRLGDIVCAYELENISPTEYSHRFLMIIQHWDTGDSIYWKTSKALATNSG